MTPLPGRRAGFSFASPHHTPFKNHHTPRFSYRYAMQVTK